MYTKFFRFFGLRENPFNINPDPGYLYLDPGIQTVLDNMASAIQARKGLILLTGEPGTGKTTLVNRLMQSLWEQKTSTAFIFNPHLELNELFDMLFANFGIPAAPRAENPWVRLSRWSIERYRMGMNAVVILDEAQGLPIPLLAEIRLLLNQQIANEGLIQIVLSGQPELEEKLKRPELRQVRQRISLRCRTTALTLEQARGYIRKRMQLAGGISEDVFAPEAIDTAYYYSRGIPRVMNLLLEHAMIRAYLGQTQPVSVRMVEEAARQLQFDDVMPVPVRPSLEPSLCADSAVGLSDRVAHTTAAVALPMEERKALPVPMPVPAVRESPRRPVLEPATTDGVDIPSELPTSASGSAVSRTEGEFGPNPISELEVRTDPIRELVAELSLGGASRSSGVPQTRNWKPRATVFRFKRENDRRTFPHFSKLRRVLLKCRRRSHKLRAALGIFPHWISLGRNEVLALTRSGVWQRSVELALRWLRGSLLTAPSQWNSTLELAKSLDWQAKAQFVVRWLQQPLPTLRPHRRAGR
jgi:general secretion pathway protein A